MANQIYSNFVMEDAFNSVLTTALNLQNFVTVDNSLTEAAGMVKNIAKRSVTGSAEDLTMGQGNTGAVEVTFSSTPYTVGTTQARFSYYDEEALADPKVVDAGIKGMAEIMVNDFVAKAVAEWEKTSHTTTGTLDFAGIVDALAALNLENEDGLFMLINPASLASFRKALKDELKYVEAFARTGYIGSVCGIPVYISKAISGTNEAIIAHKDAVRVFTKKASEIETEREGNIRKNTIYSRKVAVVALVDDTKVIVVNP
ncbi:MAG: phage major capsid protein [Paludibacteraceae bacterium]|nr:phage major capsid protein [Paludibacteraceae bacterium]